MKGYLEGAVIVATPTADHADRVECVDVLDLVFFVGSFAILHQDSDSQEC